MLHVLNVSTMGQGSVSISPDESRYEEGTQVTLTADAGDGWVFDSWEGDASGKQNPLTVTMDARKVITANFLTEDGMQDLVVNGTFSSGTDSWTFNSWSGSGEGSVENGEYKLEVGSVAENYHDIQVVQSGKQLESGKRYRVIFDAYASEERVLNVNVGMPEDPWTTFLSNVTNGESEIDLTTSKQTYSFDFTMEEPTYEDSRIEFSVGLATPTVYIDNVSLFEIDATAVAAPIKKMATKWMKVRQKASQVNITLNNFAKGRASLSVYDLKGSVVRSARLNNQGGTIQSHSFDASAMPSGYYIVNVRSGKAELKSGFILNEK